MSEARTDLRFLTRIARLYYEEGLNQTEVARRLGLTQVAVSRTLKKAEESGIVRTTVVTPPGAFTGLGRSARSKVWLEPGNRRRRRARFRGVRSECDRFGGGSIP
jgi:DNA-binding transcriptional regulator LsrR (DeoR family)